MTANSEGRSGVVIEELMEEPVQEVSEEGLVLEAIHEDCMKATPRG